MCYHTLVIHLHLPHILGTTPTSQKFPSKVACVNACREVLSREVTLRAFCTSTALCRVNDFQALLAGLTLMLAHVTSYCSHDTDTLLILQRLSDREIVQRMLECMKMLSELHEDVFAVKCGSLLKDLLAIEEAVAMQSSQSQSQAPYDSANRVITIRVPFIGAAIQLMNNDLMTRDQDPSRKGICNSGEATASTFGKGRTMEVEIPRQCCSIRRWTNVVSASKLLEGLRQESYPHMLQYNRCQR
jgi:hypothetical protein